ncbi:MAG TPA: hypothetical protein PK854_04840 [Oscillospiraceae bacterium]|nr:hypothetical protein [Oscillospiraceae bacterium]HPS34574.1 hypothetical protein [Oscillospiraceae bacterium]
MTNNIMLSDLFKRQGLDQNDVLLMRHPWKHIRNHYKDGTMMKYTAEQKSNFKKTEKFWMVFFGEQRGTTARFFACYKNNGYQEANGGNLYSLEKTDIFEDLRERLVIEWERKNVRRWCQKGVKEKFISSI